jgi:hypothetical protein
MDPPFVWAWVEESAQQDVRSQLGTGSPRARAVLGRQRGISCSIHADRYMAGPPVRVTCPWNDGVQCPQPSRRPCSARSSDGRPMHATLLPTQRDSCSNRVLGSCGLPCRPCMRSPRKNRGNGPGAERTHLRSDWGSRSRSWPGRVAGPAHGIANYSTLHALGSPTQRPGLQGSRPPLVQISHSSARGSLTFLTMSAELFRPRIAAPCPHPLAPPPTPRPKHPPPSDPSPPPGRTPGGEKITGRGGRKATLPAVPTHLLRSLHEEQKAWLPGGTPARLW